MNVSLSHHHHYGKTHGLNSHECCRGGGQIVSTSSSAQCSRSRESSLCKVSESLSMTMLWSEHETDLILKKLNRKSRRATAALTRSSGLQLHAIADFALDVVHPHVLILFLQCQTSKHWHIARWPDKSWLASRSQSHANNIFGITFLVSTAFLFIRAAACTSNCSRLASCTPSKPPYLA